MATLVFGAVGTLVGGPVGGALGALLGQQLDNTIFAPDPREGPRLTELAVTSSSYGAPIPRVFGTMRMPGTIIWATEIRESSETAGGGKGSPATTSYSYSASFAVAVSSRPIAGIGRIWADGNLLRGQAGDLKTGGTLRIHRGTGDQMPDALISSEQGPACPAFRGCSYVVFEDLQLGEFGSRIPALTFEVLADACEVTTAQLLEGFPRRLDDRRPLPGLAGISDDGGGFAGLLGKLDSVFPVAADVSTDGLTLRARDMLAASVTQLPPAAVLPRDGEGFAPQTGYSRQRAAGSEAVPSAIRYYDAARDYQPGVQRAPGRSNPGRQHVIELPASLSPETACSLVSAAAARAKQSRDRISWRLAELDPALGPGRIVSLPDIAGTWRIDGWEWLSHGVELELTRQVRRATDAPPAGKGTFLSAPDFEAEATILQAFELPPLDSATESARPVHVAASAAGPGWTGAALYSVSSAALDLALYPAGPTSTKRARIGTLITALSPSPSLMLERRATVDIELAADDLVLDSITPEQLLAGGNRALVGEEVLQFINAERIGLRRWRLGGMLRGRLGTEPAAAKGTIAGTSIALIDDRLQRLPASSLPFGTTQIAAIGLGDEMPVVTDIANGGAWARPPAPVHPKARHLADGSVHLSWVRRGRGAWAWSEGIEIPLVEGIEAYRVGIGPVDAPSVFWEVASPTLVIPAADWAGLVASHPSATIWVRQLGSAAQSFALELTQLPEELS